MIFHIRMSQLKTMKNNFNPAKSIAVCCMLLCLFIGRAKAQSGNGVYPLDPLTSNEIEKVVQILKSSNTITEIGRAHV